MSQKQKIHILKQIYYYKISLADLQHIKENIDILSMFMKYLKNNHKIIHAVNYIFSNSLSCFHSPFLSSSFSCGIPYVLLPFFI